uniref:Uncharacterized protein n=1 Tax=Magnetococcus massalia (strain MO-1) TaxID=451514 RepID=A0A1S7LCW1_MAGMO|nr:protein of unknown function [Candidatus Magnetococcus massalia]
MLQPLCSMASDQQGSHPVLVKPLDAAQQRGLKRGLLSVCLRAGQHKDQQSMTKAAEKEVLF